MFVADIFYLFGLNGVQYESYHIDQDSIFLQLQLLKMNVNVNIVYLKILLSKELKLENLKWFLLLERKPI